MRHGNCCRLRRNLPGLLRCIGIAAAAFTLMATLAAVNARPANASEVMHKRVFAPHGMASRASANTTPLLYEGGSVETAPTVYIDFWGAEWATGFTTGGYSSASAQTYIETFFTNVGGSTWLDSTVQYCQGVATGSTSCPTSVPRVGNPSAQLKGVWTDSAAAVPSSPTDTDIEAEVKRALAHFGTDPNGVYMVFSPTGKSESGFGTSWCAWHGWNSAVGSIAYAYIPYQPDAGSSCGRNFLNASDSFGHGYFDGFSVVGGHEYAEALTDPFPNSGWLDSGGNENADKCAWSQASANVTLGSTFFAVQPLWSNETSTCVVNYAPALSTSENLGGVITSAPAIASWGSSRVDVFGRGTDYALWHRSWNGTTWAGWESLGGVLTSSPAAVSWGSGRIDLFVRGTDNALWHRWYGSAGWSGWESLGGILQSAPAVASWANGRLDVFVEGTDRGLWHRWWDGSQWRGWEPLGGVLTADPGVTSSALNSLDIFVRGTDGGVWQKSWRGAWSAWAPLGGGLTAGPAAAFAAPSTLDLCVLGTDSGVWRRSSTGAGWTPWQPVGGSWTSGPAAATVGGQLDVVERGPDGSVWLLHLTP
jgi:hypothetical protein